MRRAKKPSLILPALLAILQPSYSRAQENDNEINLEQVLQAAGSGFQAGFQAGSSLGFGTLPNFGLGLTTGLLSLAGDIQKQLSGEETAQQPNPEGQPVNDRTPRAGIESLPPPREEETPTANPPTPMTSEPIQTPGLQSPYDFATDLARGRSEQNGSPQLEYAPVQDEAIHEVSVPSEQIAKAKQSPRISLPERQINSSEALSVPETAKRIQQDLLASGDTNPKTNNQYGVAASVDDVAANPGQSPASNGAGQLAVVKKFLDDALHMIAQNNGRAFVMDGVGRDPYANSSIQNPVSVVATKGQFGTWEFRLCENGSC